ncbi:MAG: preprotein translocase subunit YajC [Methylococcales bacterium]|jgi:preprotein translocase subunit YajC|nr:preprotein translocase subunit YajC [Methylococcales bacterium]MBT7411180.1 preprotein translocase subunit YajC [Methylococcales bacterium]
MDFFISNALAAPAGPPEASPVPLVMLILMVVFFYFVAIRPQSKKAKEHKSMVESLAKGDEAVTNGGLLGKITKVGDSFLELEISKGVEIKVQKHAIANLMPKGTIKSI